MNCLECNGDMKDYGRAYLCTRCGRVVYKKDYKPEKKENPIETTRIINTTESSNQTTKQEIKKVRAYARGFLIAAFVILVGSATIAYLFDIATGESTKRKNEAALEKLEEDSKLTSAIYDQENINNIRTTLPVNTEQLEAMYGDNMVNEILQNECSNGENLFTNVYQNITSFEVLKDEDGNCQITYSINNEEDKNIESEYSNIELKNFKYMPNLENLKIVLPSEEKVDPEIINSIPNLKTLELVDYEDKDYSFIDECTNIDSCIINGETVYKSTEDSEEKDESN